MQIAGLTGGAAGNLQLAEPRGREAIASTRTRAKVLHETVARDPG
jgi:hypothetical protein